MNIVEEIARKYEGKYSEEAERSIYHPTGKYTFHPQNGLIEVGDTKILININAVGGAAQTTEPYRIVLFLKDDNKRKLEVFPKSTFQRIISLFDFDHSTGIQDKILKQFKFKGDKILIDHLLADYSFCKTLLGEKIYIVISSKHPNRIVLSPSYGIDSLDQFEKYLSIIQKIEFIIDSNST